MRRNLFLYSFISLMALVPFMVPSLLKADAIGVKIEDPLLIAHRGHAGGGGGGHWHGGEWHGEHHVGWHKGWNNGGWGAWNGGYGSYPSYYYNSNGQISYYFNDSDPYYSYPYNYNYYPSWYDGARIIE